MRTRFMYLGFLALALPMACSKPPEKSEITETTPATVTPPPVASPPPVKAHPKKVKLMEHLEQVIQVVEPDARKHADDERVQVGFSGLKLLHKKVSENPFEEGAELEEFLKEISRVENMYITLTLFAGENPYGQPDLNDTDVQTSLPNGDCSHDFKRDHWATMNAIVSLVYDKVFPTTAGNRQTMEGSVRTLCARMRAVYRGTCKIEELRMRVSMNDVEQLCAEQESEFEDIEI